MPTFGGALWGGGGSSQAIQTGVPVRNYFYLALRLAGVTKLPDGSYKMPSPDQLSDCLLVAQLLLSQADLRKSMVYSMLLSTYVLGTAEAYTLGPSGTLVSTAGVSVRPVMIEEARLILASTGTPVHLGIHKGSYQEFASLAVLLIPGALPKFLYCDYAFPTAKVYLIPQDQGGDTLELYTWTPMPNLVAVTDLVNFPPGYDDWFVNNMAVRLAALFKEMGASVSDDVRHEARRTEALIQSRNTKTPRQSSDAPRSRRSSGDFNYFSGADK